MIYKAWGLFSVAQGHYSRHIIPHKRSLNAAVPDFFFHVIIIIIQSEKKNKKTREARLTLPVCKRSLCQATVIVSMKKHSAFGEKEHKTFVMFANRSELGGRENAGCKD